MGGFSTGKGGDKLNFELNLVPFIDLLSALVLFLLVTAVWAQISAIPASVETAGKKTTTPTPATPPEERLVIHVTAKGQDLTWPTANGTNLPKSFARTPTGFDYGKLTQTLRDAVKTKAIASAGVSADTDVEYGDVVETIDAVKMAGIGSVAISTQ